MLEKYQLLLKDLLDAPMEKELFHSTQECFQILGVNLVQTNQKCQLNINKLRTFLAFGTGAILDLCYVIYLANTFEEYIASFYVLSSMLICLSTYSFVIWKMKKFVQLFVALRQTVQEKLESSESKIWYKKTGRLIELTTQMISYILVNLCPPIFLMPKCIISVYAYFATDLGNDAFEMPFPIWVPFEWKNPCGYSIAVTIQTFIAWHNFCYTSCMVTFGIGMFLILLCSIKDLKFCLHQINGSAQRKRGRFDAEKRLSKFIEDFSKLKHFVHEFSDVFQLIHVILFLWCILTICGALLMFQVEMRANNLILIVHSLVLIAWSTGLAFSPCEIGERVSIAFVEVCDEINDLDWYAFPFKMQKILPLIMIHAQDSVDIECFGSISCCRSLFKSITNSACSYFMILRRFNA